MDASPNTEEERPWERGYSKQPTKEITQPQDLHCVWPCLSYETTAHAQADLNKLPVTA